ncbi:MAG TPA: acetylxylan esterase, partial [Steroidobacteraceae bacterium]|nr:acetylxylan esterase [Steroidobacteraceae bacterium]
MKKFAVALLALLFALPASADAISDTRAAYLQVIDRPHVPPKAELTELAPVEGLRKIHFWFSSDATERVPGYLLLPDPRSFKGPRPVVIALHGTGGNKDSGQIATIVLEAAKAGFIGVAIDGRFHGERTQAGSGAAAYNEAIARAFKTGEGHPFYYDSSWDVMRLVDYLATRRDVDAKRIGLTGISKGGIETYFTAAADPRIAAAVPYIG